MLEATGVEFEWDEHPAGEDVYEAEGNPFPDRTLESIKRTKVGIKGPTTTPVGSGFRSINVQLRKELDLYACIRPCKALRGRPHPLPGDRHRDRPREHRGPLRGHRVRAWVTRTTRRCARRSPDSAHTIREDAGISIKPISVFGSDRIVEAAFSTPRTTAASKVTAAHKANIMKFSDGLFLETARKVAERHPGHRVRGPDHRQPLQPARLAPRGVRRDRAAEPLRRHRLRPRRRADRRAGVRPRRQHRHRGRDVRGDPRLGAEVQGAEQGQPDRADALRRADAAPPRRGRCRRQDGGRDRGRDQRRARRSPTTSSRPATTQPPSAPPSSPTR